MQADISAKDKQGETSLDLAKKVKDNASLLALLTPSEVVAPQVTSLQSVTVLLWSCGCSRYILEHILPFAVCCKASMPVCAEGAATTWKIDVIKR